MKTLINAKRQLKSDFEKSLMKEIFKFTKEILKKKTLINL